MKFRWLLPTLAAHGYVLPAQALSTVECTEAHFSAQVARAEGRLLEAEEQLSLCGHPSCPGVLTTECGEWLKEVSRQIPSIVVVALDAREQDVMEFDLSVDGAPVTMNELGAVRLDPGKHEIVVTADGFLERRQMIRLRVGEQHRRISLLMADASPRGAGGNGVFWPLSIFGALTMAGAAGFTYFGLEARDSERALQTCDPDCTNAEVSAVRSKYTAANLSLAVGLSAVAAGGLYFALRPGNPRGSSVGVSIAPNAAAIRFSGSF